MAEYIDRDIAIAKMTDLFVEFPDEIGYYLQGRCIGALLFETAADVIEIKHGYWKPQPFVPTKGIPTSEAVCSVCGRDAVYKIVDNKYYFEDYCPHCGAKMDGEHNEK